MCFFAGDLWTDRRGIVCRAGGLYAGCEDVAAGGPTGWRLHRTSAVVTTAAVPLQQLSAAAAIAAAAIAAVAMMPSVIVVLFVLAFTFFYAETSLSFVLPMHFVKTFLMYTLIYYIKKFIFKKGGSEWKCCTCM
jgi:hypothetical protein